MGPEVISMQDVDVIHADTAKHTRLIEKVYIINLFTTIKNHHESVVYL